MGTILVPILVFIVMALFNPASIALILGYLQDKGIIK